MANDNVTPIRPTVHIAGLGNPNPSVIDTLKALLACAEAGDITGLAYVGRYPDGAVIYDSVGVNEPIRMIGALAILQHDLTTEYAERDE